MASDEARKNSESLALRAQKEPKGSRLCCSDGGVKPVGSASPEDQKGCLMCGACGAAGRCILD
ncbi:MAG: hypothetical protein AB9866_11940 [Syntrophobacteraceae bacterium]